MAVALGQVPSRWNFVSPDVLDPKHSFALVTVPMVKANLRALLLGRSGNPLVQIVRMESSTLLTNIDAKFGGNLEIKGPGSINVEAWHAREVSTWTQ